MPLFFAYCPDRVGDDVLAKRLSVRSQHFQDFKQSVQDGHAGESPSLVLPCGLSFPVLLRHEARDYGLAAGLMDAW